MLDAVALSCLLASVLGSGAAVLLFGGDPTTLWTPRNTTAACPPDTVAALHGASRRLTCLSSCPAGTHAVLRHCLHPPEPSETWGLRWWTLDDDLEPLPMLVPLALGAGFAASTVYAYLLRWSSGVLLFAAVYASPVAIAIAALRADGTASWALSAIATLLLLLAAVLTDSLLCAARITARAASLSRGAIAGTIAPLVTSATVLCVASVSLLAAASVLATGVAVQGREGSVLLRDVRVVDQSRVQLTLGVAAAGVWVSVWTLHIGRLTAAHYMVPRVLESDGPPGACRAFAKAVRYDAATAASGSLVACTTAAVAMAARRATRHASELQLRGYRIARPICKVCRSVSAACAAAVHVAVPVVYTTAAVYRVGFFPASRKLATLAGSQPVLFAVVQGSLQLVRAIELIVCALTGAGVAIITGNLPPVTVATCAAAGALASALTYAPLAAAAEAGMVAQGAGKARDAYDDLLLPDP